MPVQYWTAVQEERQAEFLVRDFFDWSAVAEIGVMNEAAEASVRQVLVGSQHVPAVSIRRQWYY
jgi:ssDNA thymidine ADP-ribosyltransferase, DarT